MLPNMEKCVILVAFFSDGRPYACMNPGFGHYDRIRIRWSKEILADNRVYISN